MDKALPQFICLQCNTKLAHFVDFRHSLIENSKLLEIIEQMEEEAKEEDEKELTKPIEIKNQQVYIQAPIKSKNKEESVVEMQSPMESFDSNMTTSSDDSKQQKETTPGKYSCDSCVKTFKHPRSLQDHVDVSCLNCIFV